jgi:hypothetical protein
MFCTEYANSQIRIGSALIGRLNDNCTKLAIIKCHCGARGKNDRVRKNYR